MSNKGLFPPLDGNGGYVDVYVEKNFSCPDYGTLQKCFSGCSFSRREAHGLLCVRITFHNRDASPELEGLQSVFGQFLKEAEIADLIETNGPTHGMVIRSAVSPEKMY